MQDEIAQAHAAMMMLCTHVQARPMPRIAMLRCARADASCW